MSATRNYSWDFDRPDPQWMERYFTFSVGIFQWLTKASGEGLKQSRAICRVLGYTPEPERVYAKALELSARLNREGASAANPPSWLQKQYSVPRPAGMVIKRKPDKLTAAQVRGVRLKVMKDCLLPAGFVVGKDASYVRRRDDQIHLVNYDGYGGAFRLNVGFHYTFIPPLFRKTPLTLADFHLLDCIARSDISEFLPKKRHTWFDYGEDRKALAEKLQLCASRCLSVFDQYVERWRDPRVLLTDLSSRGRPRWRCEHELALGWIELRSGHLEAAEKRLAERSDHRCQNRPALDVSLRNLIDQHRKQRSRNDDHVHWKQWVDS